ncbi:MAG TPA: 4-hydroxybenzoate octaprenyltransferase [Phycisphaerae bacterium]|nr:4-hydroxybenzoate octaprenyltransferase [Phycisphaerae bacterium]
MSDAASAGAGTSFVAGVRTWADMIKFAHSVFALPFALMATFLAGRNLPEGRPGLLHLVLIVVCMVAARSVAMTFNRIADARLDALNPRTADRPLPAGKLTIAQAWVFLALFFATFAAGCISFFFWLGNPWPMWLGGPVLLFLCVYSFAKRFTRYAHFWLGAAIGLSPVAAWIAIDPASLGVPAVLLAATVTCWIAGFDIIYACQDIAVDRREGLHSLPSRIGPRAALWVTRGLHLVVVVLLIALGRACGLGWLYHAGVAAVAVLLVIENAAVRADDFSRVNLAFFTINGLVSLALGACAIADVLLGLAPIW